VGEARPFRKFKRPAQGVRAARPTGLLACFAAAQTRATRRGRIARTDVRELFADSGCTARAEARGSFGRLVVLGALLLALIPLRASAAMSADARRSVLTEANAAYDQGAAILRTKPQTAMASFVKAIEGYESLVDDGVRNGRLYYNLGNAYLQVGRVGLAIANYRRAQRLLSGDPQLEHNLTYARSLRRNSIESAGERAFWHTAFFWHFNTSIVSRYWVAIVAYLAFWSLLGLRLIVKAPGLRVAAMVMLPIWLAAGGSVAIESIHRANTPEGVTTSSDIVVRKGNGEGYDPQFAEKLHEGVEFIVIEQRPGWLQIELRDASRGWIKSEQAELI